MHNSVPADFALPHNIVYLCGRPHLFLQFLPFAINIFRFLSLDIAKRRNFLSVSVCLLFFFIVAHVQCPWRRLKVVTEFKAKKNHSSEDVTAAASDDGAELGDG